MLEVDNKIKSLTKSAELFYEFRRFCLSKIVFIVYNIFKIYRGDFMPRILVVDDERDICVLISRYAEKKILILLLWM